MRTKVTAILEILLVYAGLQVLTVGLRDVMRAEVQRLGWSYLGSLFFVGVPALVIWLTRRRWSDYGVTLSHWPANLEIGLRAYCRSRHLWVVIGAVAQRLQELPGGLLIAFTEIVAIAVMLWVLKHEPQPE